MSHSLTNDIVMAFQAEMGKLLRGKPADPAQFLSTDVQWHLPDSVSPIIGEPHRKGIHAVLDLLQTAPRRCYRVESMRFDFHHLLADDRHVHLHFTLQAETVNGKHYKSGYQTLYELDEGRIIRVWEYFDSGLLLQLLDRKN